jgi:tetratricopeptide (TPR) repeat protein
MTRLTDFPHQQVPPFDTEAQERIAARLRRCPPETFLKELLEYAPRTREQETSFEKFHGWALYDAGEFDAARKHLIRGLRRSRRGTRDRSIMRGLLAELCMRLGRLEVAERCATRALSDIPEQDPGGYLRAGHLASMARVLLRQGHLSHSIEMFRRALAYVDSNSPHWPALTANLSKTLFLRGNVHEADALVRASREAFDRGSPQEQRWGMATVEVTVALALGDLERADRALAEAYAEFSEDGERVRFGLDESKAEIFRAKRQWRESADILRTILERCEFDGRQSDFVSAIARALAESLEGLGEHEAALEPATTAARAGALEDRVEWVRALHVLGRCLAALGRTDEARRRFKEALSIHERTQFDAERKLLEATLERLGFQDLGLGRPAPASLRPGRPSVERLRMDLQDRRTFFTTSRPLLQDIRVAAASDLPVLLEGETGTGKELVARLLHEQGPRARLPFVVVDCATLPADLADVELFGAARGAYTGAHRDRPGLIAQADRGTLFLDELPLLSPALQGKLLRVIQEGTYRRLGEDQPRRVRLRFIAATNRAIEELLARGELKSDLFYRLNGHRITLKPLRQRREEIGLLAEEFAQACGMNGLTAAALQALQSFAWPGNVRQLEMAIRVAASRCRPGTALDASDLELPATESAVPPLEVISLREGRVAWERDTLLRALEENEGVVARAARSLGMTRQAFYVAMRRTSLTPRRRRVASREA